MIGNTLRNIVFACAVIGVFTPVPQSTTPASSSRVNPIAGTIVLTVDPAQSIVHWSLESSLHTVHGTFHVKRGSLSVDPATGKATGEIVVDATSGESGNGSRDHRMHKEILETARYSEVVFRPDHVDGAITSQGNSDLKMHGIFTLHGDDHEFTAPAQAQLSGNEWKGSTTFTVPYLEWKLKNPNNFLLKVKPTVEVHVDLVGSVARR
jgi:polyisoprenoid-binding protein YceI